MFLRWGWGPARTRLMNYPVERGCQKSTEFQTQGIILSLTHTQTGQVWPPRLSSRWALSLISAPGWNVTAPDKIALSSVYLTGYSGILRAAHFHQQELAPQPGSQNSELCDKTCKLTQFRRNQCNRDAKAKHTCVFTISTGNSHLSQGKMSHLEEIFHLRNVRWKALQLNQLSRYRKRSRCSSTLV